MEIRIRQFTADDAASFLAAITESVDHLSPWLAWCSRNYGMEEAHEWASTSDKHWRDGTDYRMLIEEVSSGQVLGSVGLNQIVDDCGISNLGYWVRQSAINQNVCATASRQFVELLFEEYSFKRIEITIHPDNHASNAVAIKIGAAYEGIFRNKIVHNGISVAAKCYSIIPEDYSL